MTHEMLKLSGIGGLREVTLVQDLGDGRARVRFVSNGNTKVVPTNRILGWRKVAQVSEDELADREDVAEREAHRDTRPSPPPMMRASELLPPARPEFRPVPKPPGPAQSPKYLAFVRAHPCCLCGAPGPSHAHHQGPRGMSQKTDDYRTIPLCDVDHDGVHASRRPQLTKGLVAHAQRELLVEYVRGLEGT